MNGEEQQIDPNEIERRYREFRSQIKMPALHEWDDIQCGSVERNRKSSPARSTGTEDRPANT